MTRFGVWSFDTAEDAPGALAEIRADGPVVKGSGTVVGISWLEDEVVPRLKAADSASELGVSEDGRAGRRAWLLDVIFLEPLRRASRGEAPDFGHPASRFGLTDTDVNRLRDAVGPGRSVVVTSEADMSDAVAETLMARRPAAQWKVEAEPGL
jgi:hypothetical protein